MGFSSSFEIESFSREHLKGNIYKGVVHRIHPALEAAFVDIGAERDAFLPLDEICFRNLPERPAATAATASGRRRPRINDVLKPGEEILVQIVKEQFANKPPTLSTFYSLPGRYLVLLPGSDDAGISRRIEGDERVRMRELIEKLEPPEGFGIIVRTAAGFDQGTRELQRDLTYLQRLWESIQQAAATKRAPALVYREHDLVLRNIRDYFTPDIDEIYIDNEEVFQRAREFLRDVMPGKEARAAPLRGRPADLLALQRRVADRDRSTSAACRCKSGGSIVIDGTEALTAIDVNSGALDPRRQPGRDRLPHQPRSGHRDRPPAAAARPRRARSSSTSSTCATRSTSARSRRRCATAMHSDKARHEIGRISQFGLLEISRQRLRPAAAATSYTACPMCEGHGLVRTTESAALVALRKIHHRVAQGDVAAVARLPAAGGGDLPAQSEARRPGAARAALRGAHPDRAQRAAHAAPVGARGAHPPRGRGARVAAAAPRWRGARSSRLPRAANGDGGAERRDSDGAGGRWRRRPPMRTRTASASAAGVAGAAGVADRRPRRSARRSAPSGRTRASVSKTSPVQTTPAEDEPRDAAADAAEREWRARRC